MKEVQSLPQEIIENKNSIDLYKWGIWFIGSVLILIVVSMTALSIFSLQAPDMLGNIGILLAGALVSLINYDRMR